MTAAAEPWTPRHPTLTADEITAMVDAAMPGAPWSQKAAMAAFVTITRTRETAEKMLADEAVKWPRKTSEAA
jgi:hypothetical protein